MRIFLVILAASLSACGKCGSTNRVTLVSMRPAQSVETQYTGKCENTWSENWTQYEMSWSDGSVGCFERSYVEENGIAPGYTQEFCVYQGDR